MDVKKIGAVVVSIIIILVIAGVTFVKSTNKNDETENVTQNIVEENIYNEENDVEDNNIVEENIVVDDESIADVVEEDTTPVDPTTIVPSSQVYESDSGIGTTDKKEAAINLVKEYWGEDSTVSFRCDSVTMDGEYIIAVVSHESASVEGYFRVNLQNKTVDIEY